MMDNQAQKAKLEALKEIMGFMKQKMAESYKPQEAAMPEAGPEEAGLEIEIEAKPAGMEEAVPGEEGMPEDEKQKLLEMYSKMGG